MNEDRCPLCGEIAAPYQDEMCLDCAFSVSEQLDSFQWCQRWEDVPSEEVLAD